MNQSLLWEYPQALEPHKDKNQITPKKNHTKYAKVWALSKRYD
jgi:hypothetical protein